MSIILGIDPGSRITGYGVVDQRNKQLSYIDSGCIRTGNGDFSQRLLVIFNAICQLLETYRPVEVAIEQVFMHKNANAALKLGHARGVAMVAAASHRLKISEYSPREIKLSLVGHGGAEKEQVNHMVRHILNLNAAPQVDAGDALAAAICHSNHMSGVQSLAKYGRRRRRSVR